MLYVIGEILTLPLCIIAFGIQFWLFIKIKTWCKNSRIEIIKNHAEMIAIMALVPFWVLLLFLT